MPWHDAAATVGGVAFDRDRGIGAVPDGAEIERLGACVLMRPSTFLSLAARLRTGEAREGTIAFLASAIERERPLAPAFLRVDPPGIETPCVCGHEGRHRMRAILAARGDGPVPVHILRPWRRASQMDDAWLGRVGSRLLDEDGAFVLEGRLFGPARVAGRTFEGPAAPPTPARTRFEGVNGPAFLIEILCAAAGRDPSASVRDAAAAFRDDPGPAMEALRGAGHRQGEREVGESLESFARRHPGPLAAVLGAAKIARHAGDRAARGAPAP